MDISKSRRQLVKADSARSKELLLMFLMKKLIPKREKKGFCIKLLL
jgi:hypothetical protein